MICYMIESSLFLVIEFINMCWRHIDVGHETYIQSEVYVLHRVEECSLELGGP
jgi:hypothetical protein